jgi:hypothetical protein
MMAHPRRGSFLLICLGLIVAMAAMAYGFVLSMRIAVDAGPASTARTMSEQSAKAGVNHVCELLLRDYLHRPQAPTSLVSPHRITFDPIDAGWTTNTSPYGRAPASGTIRAENWSGDDVLPPAKLVNPYRQYERDYDLNWESRFTSPAIPRYLEPMHWSLSQYSEAGKPHVTTGATDNAAKTRYTVPWSSPPDLPVDTPVYYDGQWRPVATRDEARYRLRYAVTCEDLSGHPLSGRQAAFDRNDPLAIDGDLIPSGQAGRGNELDRQWILKYAPAVNLMEAPIPDMTLAHVHGHTPFTKVWLASGSTTTHDQGGDFDWCSAWTQNGVLTRTGWWWSMHPAICNMYNLNRFNPPEVIKSQVGSTLSPRSRWVPNLSYSWGQNLSRAGGSRINIINEPPAVALATLYTPYGASSRWDGNPDPEHPWRSENAFATLALDDYAYHSGPTDCPWRINPLTAPNDAFAMMFNAYRSPWVWELRLSGQTFSGMEAAVPGKRLKEGGNGLTNCTVSAMPQAPISTNWWAPNPFRHTFSSRRRGTNSTVHPFAQFIVSPTAHDPRSQTDPLYPSPQSGIVRRYPQAIQASPLDISGDDLGRYSALFQPVSAAAQAAGSGAIADRRFDADRFFGAAKVFRLGACSAVPCTSDGVRPVSLYGTTLLPPRNPSEVHLGGRWEATDPKAGYNWKWQMSPFSIPIPDDSPFPSPSPRQGYVTGSQPLPGATPAEVRLDAYGDALRPAAGNSVWMDALAALSASVSTATAAYQLGTVYPSTDDSGFLGGGGRLSLDTDTDNDGFKETASHFMNVADLDRLFLRILGEDPNAPGANLSTRTAVFPVMRVNSGVLADNKDVLETPKALVPAIILLRPYDSSKPTYSPPPTSLAVGTTQHPLDPAAPINLCRNSLLNIRRNLYLAEPEFQAEAQRLVRSGDATLADQKLRQLMRCRLRDAERIINDMRMSFFGANLRYLDSNRRSHSSKGRFRPYDLDGDGWAICSAYCPSDVTGVLQQDYYRFCEPTDWTKVVYDQQPDNPGEFMTAGAPTSNGSVWVCFQDVDPAVATNLTNDPTTSDFLDFMTYTSNDGSFTSGPVRSGFTRWFYPAVRVCSAVNATDGAVTDGVAYFPPDTYFSLSGYFTLEKSHFYRIFVRGEVWDEWRKAIVDFSLLESVFCLDPDGDVPTTNSTKRTGLGDTGIIYQRWLRDGYRGGTDLVR